MKTEQIAIIGLIIIVVGSLSFFLLVQPNEDGSGTILDDILNNLIPEGAKIIEEGDCADVNYIGKYATNSTVFQSSYTDIDNKTGFSPLQIYVTQNKTQPPPERYEEYTSVIIDGLLEGLIGLKEGETTTIGPIPPEKAYGDNKLSIGDTFSSMALAPYLNITVEVTQIDEDSFSLKWTDFNISKNFTMPSGILLENTSLLLSSFYLSPYDSIPPYFIWENSSKIQVVTDKELIVFTTPDKNQSLVEEFTMESFIAVGDKMGFLFPDATTAIWNETKISIISTPQVGSIYSLNSNGEILNLTITNVTDENINVSFVVYDQQQFLLVNRSIEFNRTYNLRYVFEEIPINIAQVLFYEELTREGYSLHNLAGESLIFEVTIENVYKTSQEESS